MTRQNKRRFIVIWNAGEVSLYNENIAERLVEITNGKLLVIIN